ncbi:MAG: hypothetical protein NXI31_19480 [bacterium]|nr:hypothetical protein [bacterium]
MNTRFPRSVRSRPTRGALACGVLGAFLVAPLSAPLVAQCGLVADLTSGNANNGNIAQLTSAFGNELYFTGFFPTTGAELWKWTPTGGAQIVVDLAPGSRNSSPSGMTPVMTVHGPRVFYSGFEIGHGHELYATDGTAAGTGRVLEIKPGSSSSLPHSFCGSGGLVFFNADDPTYGEELWASDGTTAGTQRLSDFAPGTLDGRPNDMIDLDGIVLFSAFTPATGRELFVSDGTPAGTHLLVDIEPGAAASNPRTFIRAGDEIWFVATTSQYGAEIWRTDGTATGTVMVGDILRPSSFGPHGLCACGDRVFFHEFLGSNNGDVYVTDGTAAGTVNLTAGTFVYGNDLVCSGDRVFFRGSNSSTGTELYVTDGTPQGTRMVADLRSPGSSSPQKIIDCGPGVIFEARSNHYGEIWFSDGTAAGTRLVCETDPNGNSGPQMLTMCRGRVFFEAYSPTYGRELFGVATPGASAAVLGNGSAPDHPTLRTDLGAVPVLGTTVDLTGRGVTGATGFLMAGNAAPPNAVPVAPALIEFGADWVGLQAGTAVHVATLFAPSFIVPFVVPNDPAFEGVRYQFQAVWFDASASPLLQISNGLQLTVGTAAPH